MQVARSTVEFVARQIGCRPEEVLVASTGVIGVDLDLDKVTRGVTDAAAALSRDGHHDALLAIMTTDPFPKEAAVKVETGVGTFHVGGMTKGSGMIEPMMATMLGFLTCDAQVEPALLKKALTCGGARHVQRDHRRRRVFDQRYRVCAGQRRERCGHRRLAVSRFRGRTACGIEGARHWHRPRRRRRDQACQYPSHRREGVGARRARRADHRELAAGQNGGARRRPELGPVGRGSRTLRRAVRPVARGRPHRRDRAFRERAAARPQRRKGSRFIYRARISTSKSISAPAGTNTPRSGHAISAPST